MECYSGRYYWRRRPSPTLQYPFIFLFLGLYGYVIGYDSHFPFPFPSCSVLSRDNIPHFPLPFPDPTIFSLSLHQPPDPTLNPGTPRSSPLTIDLTGILQSAAFWVSNRGGTSGRKLYFYFYLMTTGLSAVLGNDPVILSGTAFLVYFTKIAGVSHVAWIFSEFVTCNTASMLLFVGMDPTSY